MDFRTIKTNLDKNVYPNAEAFAQHVRLVFQNAIMYNQGREHPVHIAANILSSRFEERLRQMLVSLNRGTYPSEEPAPQMVKVQRQSSGGRYPNTPPFPYPLPHPPHPPHHTLPSTLLLDQHIHIPFLSSQ